MATTALSLENPTLLDVIKVTNPDGSIAKVVELLTKKTPALEDMTFVEGNLPTGHRFTTRTGLPSIGWRRFNEGVASGKSRTDQIDETCGMLEGRSVVDVHLAKLNGNEAAYRAQEDMSFLASFRNELETGIFYHSTKTAPEKFMGLAPRLDSLSGPYADQIVTSQEASSGNDQSSMWFVTWSPETVFAIYPKGSAGGIQFTDRGVQGITDGSGNRFDAYEGVWNWKIGLCVKDARYVARIASIDVSAIAKTGKLLLEDMIDAYHRLQDHTTGRLVIYCNRTIAKYLHLQAMDTVKNSTLAIENIGGRPVTTFLGAPVRVTDALTITEAAVA